MKKIYKPLILSLGILLITLNYSGCTSKDKNGAPEFTVYDLSGKQLSSSNLKGKVVFVHFWATWCRYCLKEIPTLNELYNQYKDKGVTFVALTLDEKDSKSVQMLKNHVKIDYPLAWGNEEIVKKFSSFRGLPSTFIISPDWKIAQHIKGYVPKTVFEEALNKLIGLQDKADKPL